MTSYLTRKVRRIGRGCAKNRSRVERERSPFSPLDDLQNISSIGRSADYLIDWTICRVSHQFRCAELCHVVQHDHCACFKQNKFIQALKH